MSGRRGASRRGEGGEERRGGAHFGPLRAPSHAAPDAAALMRIRPERSRRRQSLISASRAADATDVTAKNVRLDVGGAAKLRRRSEGRDARRGSGGGCEVISVSASGMLSLRGRSCAGR